MDSNEEIRDRGDGLMERQEKFCCGMFIPSMMLIFLLGPILLIDEPDNEFAIVHNCYSGSSCFELEDGNAVWRRNFDRFHLENQAITLRMIPESSENSDFLFNLSLSVSGGNTQTSTEGHQILTETKDCHIECDSDTCKKCNLFYLPTIEYDSYTVELTFLDPIPEQINSIKFELRFMKRDFTFRLLVFKYSLLFLSVVSLVFLLSSLRTVPIRDWPLDTKLATVVNVSLILLNDPLFILNTYRPSKAIYLFSSFCVAQFTIIVLGCCFIYLQKNKNLRQKVLYGIVLISLFVLTMILFAELEFQNRYGLHYGLNTAIVMDHIFVFLGFVVLGIIALVFTVPTPESIESISNDQVYAKSSAIMSFLLALIHPFIPIVSYGLFFPFCNIFVFFLVLACASEKVSNVQDSNYNQLEEEIEDIPGKIVPSNINLTEEEIEIVEFTN